MKRESSLICPICNSNMYLVNSDGNNDDIYYYNKRNTYACDKCSAVLVAPAYLGNQKFNLD